MIRKQANYIVNETVAPGQWLNVSIEKALQWNIMSAYASAQHFEVGNQTDHILIAYITWPGVSKYVVKWVLITQGKNDNPLHSGH